MTITQERFLEQFALRLVDKGFIRVNFRRAVVLEKRIGNQFLANIREVDAIVHVVRCFEDSNIVHVDGSIDPLRDIETINLELIFSDLEILERRISKAVRAARNDKTIAKELALMERIKAHLEDGKMAKSFDDINDEDEQAVAGKLQSSDLQAGHFCCKCGRR